MRYRSRRVLVEMAINPEFKTYHGGKFAAIEKTIAVPTGGGILGGLGGLETIVALLLAVLSMGAQLIINDRHTVDVSEPSRRAHSSQ